MTRPPKPAVVTPQAGGNAYATLADAERWFAARHHPEWAVASVAARSGALIRAAEWLDHHFRFRGTRLRPDQPRAWPRSGLAAGSRNPVSGLPLAVEQAYFVLALALLEGDAAAEQLLGVRGAILEERIGNVAVQYDRAGQRQSRLLALLRPWLCDPGQILVTRS